MGLGWCVRAAACPPPAHRPHALCRVPEAACHVHAWRHVLDLRRVRIFVYVHPSIHVACNVCLPACSHVLNLRRMLVGSPKPLKCHADCGTRGCDDCWPRVSLNQLIALCVRDRVRVDEPIHRPVGMRASGEGVALGT